ncbi:MAG: histone deacetylase [Pseudomonadota bacterium]
MSRTGFAYDPRALSHNPGEGHPERAARLEVTHAHLAAVNMLSELAAVAPSRASSKWITAVHDPGYVERAKSACTSGQAFLDVADVGVSRESFEVAELAAGAGIALADAVCNGDLKNGFSMMRPPGHHAEHNQALGFCVFNNVAVVAKYLQSQHGIDRVAIIDWDVHHGNGTQHTFWRDPSVLYASLHQYPYYPGTGAAGDTGDGDGDGATVNCPMPAGAGDAAYRRAWDDVIEDALDAFAPEFVLVSAGFDAHAADPLAQVQLTDATFEWMTDRVLSLAERHAGGRLVSLLEGGYSLDALPGSVETHLRRLIDAGH